MNRALATGQELPETYLDESTWVQVTRAYRVAELAFWRIAYQDADAKAEAVEALENMRRIVSERG